MYIRDQGDNNNDERLSITSPPAGPVHVDNYNTGDIFIIYTSFRDITYGILIYAFTYTYKREVDFI